MTRRNATLSQKMDIYSFLGESALEFDEEGKALGYKFGYSDEVVAKSIAPNVSQHTVAKVRLEVYNCKLREPTHGIHGSSLTARVIALEEQVAKLNALANPPQALIPRREVA